MLSIKRITSENEKKAYLFWYQNAKNKYSDKLISDDPSFFFIIIHSDFIGQLCQIWMYNR